MPDLNVAFGGGILVAPGAYYQDNVAAALEATIPTTPPLIFIGYGYGQQPQVPVTYGTPQALLNAIRGGPCSGYVPFLMQPSTQLLGAQQVTFINCGENTQSTLTLLSGTSGVILLTSTNYGLPSNLLQVQVQSGSIAGRKVTLYDAYSGQQFAQDNLGVPFQVAYNGASSGVTYSVAVSGGLATTFSISSPVSGESVTIPLNPANYGTISQVVQYLNGTGHYTAAVVSEGALLSSALDSASSISLPVSGASLTYKNVTATLGDIEFWVNTQASSLATATQVSGVTSSPGVIPNVLAFTPFAGAVSVPPTLTDYANALNVALTQAGWTVFCDSNAAGVVALLTSHCFTASQPAQGRWRRGFAGSSTGQSVAASISQAQACDSITMCYVHGGVYQTSTVTGLNTLYGGHYVAAACAGMAAANAPATPLTNKSITGNGTEFNLTGGPAGQIDQLQQGGVIPFTTSQITGEPTVISDFTTWQIDANPENVFTQQVACRWWLAYTLRNAAQPYIGTIADPVTEINILKAIKAALNLLIYSQGNPNGVLVSWDPNSLSLTYTGAQQLAAVTVNVILVGQNRFITETVNVLPLNFTITNAAA